MPPGSLALLAQGAVVSLLLAAAARGGGAPPRRRLVAGARAPPPPVLALLLFYAMPALDLRTGPYIAGTLVLIVYAGALFAEVFRGGVLAIPRPQWESARSRGLPPLAMFRKIVAPLVTRYTLPPYVNVCVMSVKASSVLSIISVWELTLAAREILERAFAVFTSLGLAAAFYFVMCFGIDRLGRLLERHLALKGFAGERA